MTEPNLEYACEGCPDAKDLVCMIWPEPAKLNFIRNHQCCPRNRKYKEVRRRVRVGQQKQKKRGF